MCDESEIVSIRDARPQTERSSQEQACQAVPWSMQIYQTIACDDKRKHILHQQQPCALPTRIVLATETTSRLLWDLPWTSHLKEGKTTRKFQTRSYSSDYTYPILGPKNPYLARIFPVFIRADVPVSNAILPTSPPNFTSFGMKSFKILKIHPRRITLNKLWPADELA